jgi:isopentenyldiphosphate isomerase
MSENEFEHKYKTLLDHYRSVLISDNTHQRLLEQSMQREVYWRSLLDETLESYPISAQKKKRAIQKKAQMLVGLADAHTAIPNPALDDE